MKEKKKIRNSDLKISKYYDLNKHYTCRADAADLDVQIYLL